jgi:hypothetical protein
VETDAREPGLLRRIEELAAAVDDDRERGEGPVLAAALTGLRAELGGLRADLGTLRADLTTLRSGVDAGVGRMSGEVAASRTETAELADRHADLEGQVGEVAGVVAELRGLLPGLRSALDTMPGGAHQVEAALGRLEDSLASRVDTVAADLRRTLASGLTGASSGNRAAETAAQEVRTAIEERLAAVEDALDGLAERLESLTRDSIGSATERIASVEARITTLAETTVAQQAQAQDDWGRAITTALGGVAQAVDRNLGTLSLSLTEAVRNEREAGRAHVEQVVDALRDSVASGIGRLEDRLVRQTDAATAATASLRGYVETFHGTTDERLEDIRGSLLSGLSLAREGLIEDLGETLTTMTEANEASRSLVESEVASLRVDLADALDEVRDRVTGVAERAGESITAALDEQRESFDEVVRGLRSDLLDRVEEARGETLAALDDLRAGVTGAARGAEDAAARLRDAESTLGALDATIEQLRAEWSARSESVADNARRSAEGVLAEFRQRAEAVVGEVAGSVDRQTEAVRAVAELLGGGTNRLVTAGQSLLGYLADRDRLLENERTVAILEMLDEFAEGLSAKDRRAMSGRLAEALERRRNARDAERFRAQQSGQPGIDVPPPPADLATLAGPLVPAPLPAAVPSLADTVDAIARTVTAPAAARRRTTAAEKAARDTSGAAPVTKRTAAKRTTRSPRATTGTTKPSTAKSGTAKTGTAKTGTAKTGTAKTGTAKTGTAPRAGAAPAGGSTAVGKPVAKSTARRKRAVVREMPTVPSPDAAVEAAIQPPPPAPDTAAERTGHQAPPVAESGEMDTPRADGP